MNNGIAFKMNSNLLVLRPCNNSPATLVCGEDGTVLGKYTFLSDCKDFKFRYMVEFYPTNELFFSMDLPEVHYCIQTTWMLFNTQQLI